MSVDSDLEDLTLVWPPTYSLKRSARTRRVSLRITARNGLELRVPLKFAERRIGAILEEKRSWIEKHLPRLLLEAQQSRELPAQIHLLAMDQLWQVSYLPAQGKIKLLERPSQQLVVFGDIADPAVALHLQKWLKQKAKAFLLPLLTELSTRAALDYQRATIRAQTSRWGSCSAQKNINLNYKLLFLPFAVVEHVILHELCHTVHLNHSARFWELLAEKDPHWEQHHRLLRSQKNKVPGWVEMGGNITKRDDV